LYSYSETTGLSSTLAAAALAVNAAPNYEITKTAITIDKHTQALNNGDIVIRLHR
jgi:hypothetical protein